MVVGECERELVVMNDKLAVLHDGAIVIALGCRRQAVFGTHPSIYG
jgi:hypothetical protein